MSSGTRLREMQKEHLTPAEQRSAGVGVDEASASGGSQDDVSRRVSLFSLGVQSQGGGDKLMGEQEPLPDEIEIEGVELLHRGLKRMGGVKHRVVVWERDRMLHFLARDALGNQYKASLKWGQVEDLVEDTRYLLLLPNKPELLKALVSMLDVRSARGDGWRRELVFVKPPKKSAAQKAKEAEKRAKENERFEAMQQKALWRSKTKYKALLYRRPHDVRAMTQLGYVHCDLGEYVEAGKVLQQAADSAEGSDLDGRFWRTLGRVHYLVYEATADSSHLEKAQSAYQEALRRIENLGNPSVWFETARVYVRFGAYEGALETLGKIIQEFPTFDRMNEVVFMSAVMLKHLQLWRQALAYFQHLLDTPPPPYTEGDLLFQVARVYEALGEVALARQAYRDLFDILKRRGQVGKTASFKAWIADASTFERFGNLYAEQQEHLLAVDAFGEAVSRALVPKVSLWFSLALSSAAIHQLQKAVVCAQNALALEPDNVEIRTMLKRWALQEWSDSFEATHGANSAAASSVQKLLRRQQAEDRAKADRYAEGGAAASGPGGVQSSADSVARYESEHRAEAIAAAMAAAGGGNATAVDPESIAPSRGPRAHVPPEHQDREQARMVEGYKRLDRGYSQAIRAAQEGSTKAERIRSQPMDAHVSMLLRSKEETDALHSLLVPKRRARDAQPLSTATHVSWKAERSLVEHTQEQVIAEQVQLLRGDAEEEEGEERGGEEQGSSSPVDAAPHPRAGGASSTVATSSLAGKARAVGSQGSNRAHSHAAGPAVGAEKSSSRSHHRSVGSGGKEGAAVAPARSGDPSRSSARDRGPGMDGQPSVASSSESQAPVHGVIAAPRGLLGMKRRRASYSMLLTPTPGHGTGGGGGGSGAGPQPQAQGVLPEEGEGGRGGPGPGEHSTQHTPSPPQGEGGSGGAAEAASQEGHGGAPAGAEQEGGKGPLATRRDIVRRQQLVREDAAYRRHYPGVSPREEAGGAGHGRTAALAAAADPASESALSKAERVQRLARKQADEEQAIREAWAEEVGAFVLDPKRHDWRTRRRETVHEISHYGFARYAPTSQYVRDWKQLLRIAARHFRNQAHMRRDVARARPKAQVPSHRLPTGAVFLALADSCGIVEEARNKLDDHEFVAEMLRLMDVIDVRHYMSLVPQSDAEQPARELLEEQEMNRNDWILRQRRRVVPWQRRRVAHLSTSDLESIIRMAHTKQLADVQRGRADATSPPRAGGDALRKLLAAVEEDERLAYKLPVHLDGAERGLPPLSNARLNAKTSVEEMEDFLARHKEEREEAVFGGSHRKQYRRFGRPHKSSKGPVTRSGRPVQSPLASRSGAPKARSSSLVGVELDGHGWGRGRYSGGPSSSRQLKHAASIASKVDSTRSEVRLEDQINRAVQGMQ